MCTYSIQRKYAHSLKPGLAQNSIFGNRVITDSVPIARYSPNLMHCRWRSRQ
ncbi:hypothetical protein H6F77_12605 [Microcoleus sp. FACHB-831]|uniref:hypothetical protein n=1 Tax=Microcoleus sp. FACHB-831 TaxID=2692827 RepID=UPI00168241AB|nr:hypothetical protein [Microcoleus sp. FACHB-831]MBD1921927.1 hypothetical protein [Microcoleus sp. FACHB-831]